ncbi:MAG: ATP-grasp domain-containing protein [Limosilactobacillus sp.]|uniref:ATP-binding protein n=1 Tax=Limosilactobacillus sp. TaxID=2773925 RepID=UPI002709A4CB|nr:ATP-grasp domain-containing protein [Limosilactobacillus sp.]
MKQFKSVLIIGAGANDVQHGDEVDAAIYQVATEYKKLGIKTILVDDNPFSVSLESHDIIDHAVIASLDIENIVDVIDKFHPQAILPTIGNSHAYEMAQKLIEKGIIQKNEIQLLGVPESTVHQVNNPVLLNRTLHTMGAPMKSIVTVTNYLDAVKEAGEMGYPVIIRSVYPKSASTRQIVHDRSEIALAVQTCLKQSRSGQIYVQQSLAGYKEIEVLVQRDSSGTMMMLSMIEDMDPIGIHAGDSIAFNPPQTLLDRQVQDIRDTAFAITRKLRIVGINHVQFALNPNSGKFYVIKNSPFFDRTSAFVAQSTGYPIAKVCAHLYLGETLREIDLGTGYANHAALMEPTMDHIAARVPVWGFEQVPEASRQLSTEKKSVGTSFGIGRNTIEALFKATEARYTSMAGDKLQEITNLSDDELVVKLVHPEAGRLFVLVEALRRGYSVEEISEMTKIDPFYIDQIDQMRHLIEEMRNHPQNDPLLVQAKYRGLSNWLISGLWKMTPQQVYQMTVDHQLTTKFKEIEPSAGEFTQHTNSFYAALEDENEGTKTSQPVALVIGTSGLRLGLSNSGDYFVTMMVRQLKNDGFSTIVVNSNPSSVNLSYPLADKRYLEPAAPENILQIIQVEQPKFVFVPESHKLLCEVLKAKEDELNCKLITINDDNLPQFDDHNTHMVSFNYLYDGKYAYSLGTITNQVTPDQEVYQPTEIRFPADLSTEAAQALGEESIEEIMKLTKPGLYQVFYKVTTDGQYEQLFVHEMPLPEVAFLSKAIGLDLVAIYTRILIGKAGADEINEFLKNENTADTAIYKGCFPFKALHVQDAEASANRMIGAHMKFIKRY